MEGGFALGRDESVEGSFALGRDQSVEGGFALGRDESVEGPLPTSQGNSSSTTTILQYSEPLNSGVALG